VSRSLLKQHPNTMLARISSKQWQEDPESEIFIDRNGDRFQYCLDYLRDGSVVLPVTVPKKAVLQDLAYYSIEDVDESSITTDSDSILDRFQKSMEKHAHDRDCLDCAMMLIRHCGANRNNPGFSIFSSLPNSRHTVACRDFELAMKAHYNLLNRDSIDSYLRRAGLKLNSMVLDDFKVTVRLNFIQS